MNSLLEIENLEPGNIQRTTSKTEISIDSHLIQIMRKTKPVDFKGWKVLSDGRYYLFFKNPTLTDNGLILNPMDYYELSYMPNSFTIAKFLQENPQNYPYGYISLKRANMFTGKDVVPMNIGYEYPSISMVRIAGRAKGTDLAMTMYEYLANEYGGIWSDTTQTSGAKALWAKLAQDSRFTVLVYDFFNEEFREIGKTVPQPEDKKQKRQQVHHEDVPVYFTFTKNLGVKLISKEEEEKHKARLQSLESGRIMRNIRLFLCLKGKIPKDFNVR